MTELTFDAATHTYRLGGQKVPSATQVLTAVLGAPQWGTEWHMERGSRAHELYAHMARGVCPENIEYDPRLRGYVDGWQAWRETTGAEFELVEHRVASRLYHYAGTLDGLIKMAGRLVLVDFKASATPHDYLQLGAYSRALAENGMPKPREAQIVEIKDSGRWRIATQLNRRELTRAENDFTALIRVWWIRVNLKFDEIENNLK